MPRQIIKVAKDQDLYIEWSSIVEAPTAVGNREEIAKHLAAPRRGEFWQTEEQVEAILTRADLAGTSARALGCTWDDHGEIYMQKGILPRAKMAEYARRLLANGDADPGDLLEPFEEEA